MYLIISFFPSKIDTFFRAWTGCLALMSRSLEVTIFLQKIIEYDDNNTLETVIIIFHCLKKKLNQDLHVEVDYSCVD